jgi:hypothetical protein
VLRLPLGGSAVSWREREASCGPSASCGIVSTDATSMSTLSHTPREAAPYRTALVHFGPIWRGDLGSFNVEEQVSLLLLMRVPGREPVLILQDLRGPTLGAALAAALHPV